VLVRALVATPAEASAERLARLLKARDVVVSVLAKGEDLFERLGREGADVVLLAPKVVRDQPRDTVIQVRTLPDRPEVVVLREKENAEERATLLSSGAMAVLTESLTDETLTRTLAALLARRREEMLRRIEPGGEGETYRLSDFASESPAMRRFMAIVAKVVSSDSSLLVLGETGAGKEWLARAIHAESPRARGPFLAVNCAALPEALLESELFGHERGAFTGAVRAHRGAFEMAHRGTIFLDEVGEIPPHLQAKLLRVLQERRITRLGGEESMRVDVRVMAATNRDLAEEVRARRFRADLFYRLGVVTLTIPPLRERREDIPSLVRGALRTCESRLGRHGLEIDADALDALVAYAWPGNVRELLNVIERAALLCASGRVTRADLPEGISGGAAVAVEAGAPAAPALDLTWSQARAQALARAEREYLVGVLQATRGRVGEAARRAGLSPRALYGKMRRHGLRKEPFR
jgi:DNA-binding NtrC family response regulator